MSYPYAVPPGRSTRPHVARACDACRQRKSKCDGQEPCERCLTFQKECVYQPVFQRKGKCRQGPRSIEITSAIVSVPLTASAHLFDHRDSSVGHDGTEGNVRSLEDAGGTATAVRDKSVENRAGHIICDNIRGSATHNFLPAQADEREEQLTSGYETDHMVLPDRQTAMKYVDAYFVLSTTYQYLSRLNIESLVSNHLNFESATPPDPEASGLILSIMALGCLASTYLDADSRRIGSSLAPSMKLYCAARSRLKSISDIPCRSLMTVQACITILALGFWQSAWFSMGRAVRIALIVGLHRARDDESIEEQIRRRTFWSLYLLDRFVCLNLNLPLSVQDASITQKFPRIVPDELGGRRVFPARAGPSSANLEDEIALSGFIARVRLSRITGRVLSKLYSPAENAENLEAEERDAAVSSLVQELKAWEMDIPPFFAPGGQIETSFADLFQHVPWVHKMQKWMMTSAYYHTKMIVYQPYLFHALRSGWDALRGGCVRIANPPQRIVECVVAARFLVAQALSREDSSRSALFLSSTHFVSSAVAVLLLYLIVFTVPDSNDILESVQKVMDGYIRESPNSKQVAKGLEDLRAVLAAAMVDERQDEIIGNSTGVAALSRPTSSNITYNQHTPGYIVNTIPEQAFDINDLFSETLNNAFGSTNLWNNLDLAVPTFDSVNAGGWY